jgi:hypothetical protein
MKSYSKQLALEYLVKKDHNLDLWSTAEMYNVLAHIILSDSVMFDEDYLDDLLYTIDPGNYNSYSDDIEFFDFESDSL